MTDKPEKLNYVPITGDTPLGDDVLRTISWINSKDDLLEAQDALLREAQTVVFKAAYFNGHAEVEKEARALLAKLEARK